jgi:hypothetical protein
MSIKKYFFILGVVFLSLTSFAETRPLRCESVFALSLTEHLNRLDSDFKKIFPEQPDTHELASRLSWWNKRKLRNLLNNFDILNVTSERALERKVLEISDLLMGSRDQLDRWVFKNSEHRNLEVISAGFREAILKKGLREAWQLHYDPRNITVIGKASDRIISIFESKLFDLAMLPWMLPRVHSQKTPSDLVLKVLRDGFDAHQSEIQRFVGAQSRVDAYQTFRKLYGPVVMGVALVLKIYVAYEIIEIEKNRVVAEALKNFEEQQDSLPKAIHEARAQIFNQAYQDALKEFRQKWGENPTTEEESAIKKKLTKGLGYDAIIREPSIY